MTKVSIALLIAGCLQFIVGVVMSAANIGLAMLGLSPGASIGLGLVMSGMITLVAGLATGIYAWRGRKEGALGAILNGAVISFLTLLIGAGVILQQVQGRKSEQAMEKYKAEQADERHKAAMESYEEYHRHLWAHKVVLIGASKISKELGCLAVGGYQVITIPQIDRIVDPVNAILLCRSEHHFFVLIKELLNAGVQDDLAALQSFARANGASCYIQLPGGFTDLMGDKCKLLELKTDLIAAIDKAAKEGR